MVYVLNQDGQPIMPTRNHAKVRVLLKNGKAKVINRCPFTIQLLYPCDNQTQSISLGVDAGSKHIGISATTKGDSTGARVLYEADVTLRNDIVELLSTRRENRRARRNRKIRYRKPRFDNRRRKDGWLAPSVQNKVNTHLTVVANACKILPVTKIVVETASFNLQKLKADLEGLKRPEGIEYQQGEQLGFWNIREYVLFRDGHTCQCCKGKSKDKILNVHHIQSRKTGGDAPNNLITLCETCHTGYHKGLVKLPESIKRNKPLKDATFMGIMRWAFYNKVKEIYVPQGIDVHMTYGYITKNTRIKNGLPKEHYIDARCISNYPEAIHPWNKTEVYYQKKVRCHNRQIHKMSIHKGGVRKLNQAEYLVKGYRLFDRVQYQGKEYFVFGRRKSGFFDIRTLDGEKVNKGSISYKKLKLLEISKGFLTERKVVA
ncbi:RNA-guided endonuclease IscB [Eubacterium oxidoreducens]|uniref:HNH endonuclease n=1 Tax=Eubacterium oxidoreducens TaxID=1732 RepID=A0A1G6ALX2_EUBOX|nr:RNA-guided endonuclease IscB [Eubacterium oxidoreducens]SDB09341.1 HNH endonuclease [Eubacterium oxidoreducens]